jgi:hypothetical protein
MIMVIGSENFIEVNMASLVSAGLGSTTMSIGAVVLPLKQMVRVKGRGQRIPGNSGGSKKLHNKGLRSWYIFAGLKKYHKA